MSAFTMTARFNGRCDCGAKVRRGDIIQYSRAVRRVTGCSSCSTHEKGPDRFDMDYEDQCARATGTDRESFGGEW